MENIQIIFGKGEYAITSANVEKLTRAVEEFTSKGIWKWCLVDNLGIKKDGTVGQRYSTIIQTLSKSEDSKVQNLIRSMSSINERVAPISHPTARTSAPNLVLVKKEAIEEPIVVVKEEELRAAFA